MIRRKTKIERGMRSSRDREDIRVSGIITSISERWLLFLCVAYSTRGRAVRINCNPQGKT
jgi:hypothetical protein